MARRFVAAAAARHEGAPLVVVAHRRVAELWNAWPRARVVVYDPSRGRARGIAATSRAIRAAGPYAVGYLLAPSLSSAILFAVSGVERRVGFAGDARGWLLSDPRSSTFGRGERHYSERLFDLLETGGDRSGSAPPAYQWPDAIRHGVAERLRAAGLAEAPYIVAAVGTEGEAKRYPVEAWIDALRAISSQVAVICTGTTKEMRLVEQVVHALGSGVYDWSGTTTLGELAVLLSSARAFVGADSGAAHLAADLGVPTAVIFGPGDPAEVRPLGAKVTVLRQPLWCAPCGKPTCWRRDHPKECLDLIPASRVAEAALAALLAPTPS